MVHYFIHFQIGNFQFVVYIPRKIAKCVLILFIKIKMLLIKLNYYSAKYHHQCSYCHGRARSGWKYCSRVCQRAAQAALRPKRTCPQCEQEFAPRGSRTIFCSRSCADKAHSLRMRGAGNSHFKTGTSYAKLYELMRPLILERDENRCIVCQASEGVILVQWRGQLIVRTTLIIHHIDENPTNNQPENLVTICKTCHAVHHKSKETPWPRFADYARQKSLSMTSKWKGQITSLQTKYSCIIA